MPQLAVPNTEQVKNNYDHPKLAKYESNQDVQLNPKRLQAQNQPALGPRKYSYQEVTQMNGVGQNANLNPVELARQQQRNRNYSNRANSEQNRNLNIRTEDEM